MHSRNNSNWYYAEYRAFIVLTEADNYMLLVAGYSGNAGKDGLSTTSNGAMFSTYDRGNDEWLFSSGNCAAYTGGGFWHKSCTSADVNSVADYGLGTHVFGWDDLPGGRELQSCRMWLQCR